MRTTVSVASPATADAGRLLLRVLIGALLLLHGIAKLQGGIGPVLGAVNKAGLPSFLAYGVYVGEVLAPILLIAGIWTRAAGLVVAFNLLVAVLLVHQAQVFSIGPQGGWAIELQALFLFGGLAIALLGAGRYSVGGASGRWN